MSPESVTTLLERDRELAELAKISSEAQQGRGQLVLVEAPAGLGKTSLLAASGGAAAQAGFMLLRARASELERDFAYGCVRQLLEQAVTKASGADRQRWFEGAASLSQPLFARSGVPQLSPSVDNPFAMLHGLYWLLNNVAGETPVAIYVDDVHWCDAESLQFLNYLAPRLDGLRIAVVASMRGAQPVAPDLARLYSATGTRVLRLEPLSTEATARLCELRFGAAVAHGFAAACRDATGGNPFFLEALLREAKARTLTGDAADATAVGRLGPTTVARAVLVRLSGAPAVATELVEAAAVLGDGAGIAEVARFVNISADEAARTADRLIALAILRPAEGVEFAHPILREAVHASIGSNRRALAHARAVEILTASGASEERIAAQIAAADPAGDPSRVALLRRVAAEALGRGAPAAAVVWLKRALAEPPAPAERPGILLELGTAELRLALPAALEHLDEAVDTIREPQLLAAAARQLANARSLSGDFDRSVAALERAIGILEPVDRERSLLLTAELAAKAQQARREARAPAANRLNRHRGLKGETPGERLVLASLAFEDARTSESASDAAMHIERGLAGGRWLEEQDFDVVGPFYALVYGLLATDALDLADSSIEHALAGASARASIPAMAYLLAHRARLMLRRGALASAEADARSALELLNAQGIELGKRFALAALVWALVERGQVDAAEQELRASGLGAEIPAGLASNDLLEARGVLRLAQGGMQAARDDLIEFGRRSELLGGANPLASRWRSRACLALAALGDAERARRLAAEDLERARRWGSATDIGVALRANAVLEGGRSVESLREAADVLRRSPSRLELARVLMDFGVALRHANRRADARSALQEALELAKACDAETLAERARIELRVAGGRARDRTNTGLQSLTVSERRVAELAARGRSNPEIAQTLFVTRKTVETHLGHVYSKLGISGRAQLRLALTNERSSAFP